MMMKDNNDIFLSEEEIYYLSLYLAYGAGLGIILGVIFDNIPLFICLLSVVGVILSVIKVYMEKLIERYKMKKSMALIRKNIKI